MCVWVCGCGGWVGMGMGAGAGAGAGARVGLGKGAAVKVVVWVWGWVRVGHLDSIEADLAVLLEEQVAVPILVVLFVDRAHAAREHSRHERRVVPGEDTSEG